MMAKVIASGSKGNLESIKDYEGQFAEGDRGSIDLDLITSWGVGTLASSLNTALRMARVEMPEPVEADGDKLRIHFKKGIAPLALIVIAILGLIALWVLISSWQLLKEIGIDPMKVMPFLLLGGVILVAYFFLKGKPGIKIGGT